MEPGTRYCTLLVTRACNLRCSYCYERHKDSRVMSVELALRIVARELGHAVAEGASAFHVIFMGGEPFLNFGVVKSVVEWLLRQDTAVKIEASATTNGTVLTDEIRAWLLAHAAVFKCQLSYDGGYGAQEANRTGMAVDLDFFLKAFPLQGLHATLSPWTLPALSRWVRDLVAKGGRCSTTLARGMRWTVNDARAYLSELRSLSDFYLGLGRQVDPIPVLQTPLGLVGQAPRAKPSCRECPNFIAYDVDGMLYPCHFFSPIVVGPACALDMAMFKRDETFQVMGGRDDPACRECPLVNWCTTCPGNDYLYTGSTGRRERSICPMLLVEVLGASEFQIRRCRLEGVTRQNVSEAHFAVAAFRMVRTRLSELGMEV